MFFQSTLRASLITLACLVVYGQAYHRFNSVPNYDTNKSPARDRNTGIDFNNAVNAVNAGNAGNAALDPSAVFSLPFGVPPELSADIPGEPLTAQELAVTIRDTALDFIPDNTARDPIELAGAFEGDIILSSAAEYLQLTQRDGSNVPGNNRNAVIQSNRVWPNGDIPYVISSTFDQSERSTIAAGIRNFHENTCIKFVPRTTQTDYIHIYKGNGCSSSVGRVGGVQSVSLGGGCVYTGIVIHELMHAAGFWHEQSRFDRDDHVRIFWENIRDGLGYNFQKYNWDTISHLDTSYDLGSIMHYGEKFFAKDPRKNTIESLNGKPIGQRSGFSKVDIEKLNKLYKCSSTEVTTVSPGGGNQNGNCRDMVRYCASWARIGGCTRSRRYMHHYCKNSCGLCRRPGPDTDDCIDRYKRCPIWAARGTCHTMPDFMASVCQKSCAIC